MSDTTTPKDDAPFDTRTDAIMDRHKRARDLLAAYNGSPAGNQQARAALLADLLGSCGADTWLEPPFFCDYGDNIHLGAGVFANFNCTILDGARVQIGDGTLLGPGVQIYATSHPLKAEDRITETNGKVSYTTTAEPIIIGKHVWIGGGAIILPGVTIGDGTTVGAGSVVTKSLPAQVFAAGNPCRVIRAL